MKNIKSKIIVVCGPTASGKSALAVSLARKFSGEIISADSRQVYRGLNIGTGKINKKEMSGVPHYMLDVANPKNRYTVVRYIAQSQKIINNILKNGKVPIICGGTGFYISALVDGFVFPEVPPNPKLRAKLEKKSASELMKILKKLDPRRAKEIDPLNKRRIARAIEIAKALGKVPNLQPTTNNLQLYKTLWIGITPSPEELRKKIHIRLFARIREGMVEEAKKLHKQGLSFKRMEELGLEYRYLAKYLNNKISKEGMIEMLEKEIWQYARRQMTWFRANKRIKWFRPDEYKNIEVVVKNFIKT
ncbi:MAG TPA: tRNA (adenosine(37)-N6)-dimethylallyltransferase MiaA [Candidatus Paceibacterota bacterium]